ncbi:MAG: TFIIB-type zinc ribbon-containing protein [Chloroflexota bacterium]|nr:TFIIB-type zinc ribbon-containing protein [Chloroflexota bacterium]
MKRCPNPDCPSSQLRRDFYDDDTVCPRCGEVLVNPTLAAGGVDPGYTAYAGTARAVRPVVTSSTHGLALLGAVGTILLVFVLIGLLRAGNMIGLGSARTGTGVSSGASSADRLVPAQATATAHAVATALSQGTPITALPGTGLNLGAPGGTGTAGAGILGVPTLGPLPPLPTPPGGYQPVGNPGVIGNPGGGTTGGPTPGTTPGGTTGGNNANLGSGSGSYGSSPQTGDNTGTGVTGATANNGALTVNGQLCQKSIDTGRCDAATSYGVSDTFALAVEATFGPNAVRRVRVHLYGPPDGTLSLLDERTSTPGRDGRFWVGFAFQQAKPWVVGRYRADIYVNDDTQPTTFVTWDVR